MKNVLKRVRMNYKMVCLKDLKFEPWYKKTMPLKQSSLKILTSKSSLGCFPKSNFLGNKKAALMRNLWMKYWDTECIWKSISTKAVLITFQKIWSNYMTKKVNVFIEILKQGGILIQRLLECIDANTLLLLFKVRFSCLIL